MTVIVTSHHFDVVGVGDQYALGKMMVTLAVRPGYKCVPPNYCG